MTTIAKVRAAAKKLGASVEWTPGNVRLGQDGILLVQAPEGFRWAEGLHEFVGSCDCDCRDKAGMCNDMLGRMESGVEKCPDPECEWCHPEE